MAEFKGILEQDLLRVQAELAVVETRRTKLLWKIEILQDLLSKCAGSEKTHNAAKPEKSQPTSVDEIEVEPTPTRQPGATAVAVIVSILKHYGRPMRVADIVSRAIEAGYGGPSATFDTVMQTFSSAISRSIKNDSETPFRRAERKMVALVEWPTSIVA